MSFSHEDPQSINRIMNAISAYEATLNEARKIEEKIKFEIELMCTTDARRHYFRSQPFGALGIHIPQNVVDNL